jgi:hypothetical protein
MFKNSILILTIVIFGITAVGFVNAFGEIRYDDNAFYLDDDGNSATPEILVEDTTTICNNIEDLNPQSGARALIIFSKKPGVGNYYGFLESAKITIKLQNWETDDTATEFICADARSETDTQGIKIILIEDKPDSNYFQILGFLRLHDGDSDDYNYGPDLQVNPEGDTLTIEFMSEYEREIEVRAGPWSADDGEEVPASNARGSVISYSPSLFPEGTAEINCSAGFGGDTDGDYICNNWEPGSQRLTITFNGATYQGPICTGSNPPDTCPSNSVKDIYVEVDAKSGFAPTDAAIANLKNAFKCGTGSLNNRACSGTNGYPNVILHVQKSDLNLTDVPDQISMPTGFNTVKNNHYADDAITAVVQKSQVFHYALFGKQIEGETSATGAGETWGNDLLITMGSTLISQPPPQAYVEGTFMHELGHNLNLWHGGNEARNCKPNHISVMNYLFQLPDMVGSRPLDYSQSLIASLYEGNLNELNGVGNSVPNELTTVFGPVYPGGPPYRTSTTGGTDIDWDNDGQWESSYSDWNSSTSPVGVDINDLGFGGCDPSSETMETLAGFKDWATTAIKYNARNSGNFEPGAYQSNPIRLELNATSIKQMQDARASFIQYEISKTSLNSTSKTALDSKIANAKQLISVNKIVPAIIDLELTKNSLSRYTNDPNEKKNLGNLIEDFKVSLKKATDYVTIKFDSIYYTTNGVATITVNDPEANKDEDKRDQIIAKVYSSIDSGFPLILIETDPNTAVFVGEINFGSNSDQEQNILAVNATSSVVASYEKSFLASAFIIEEYVPTEDSNPLEENVIEDKDLPAEQ